MIRKLETINKWLIVLLGCFISVSTALTNIVLGLFIIFWLIDNSNDRFQRWIAVIKSNPVALMGLIVFLSHLAGVAYSDAGRDRILACLMDAVKFLFISLSMVYIQNKNSKPPFLIFFILAMFITLVLSYLHWFGLLPAFIHLKNGPTDANVFLNHIAQNILMAYSAFVAAVWSRNATGFRKKFFFAVFSLLAFFNVLFLVEGRTGHVIILVLFLYYFFSWDRVKSLITGGLVILLFGVFAWFAPSNAFFLRARTVMEEIHVWESGKPAKADSSSGLRLEYYINTIELIKKHPLFGTGAGSFENAYAELVKDTGMQRTDNPHNEYLMVGAQFGITGLLILLSFFGVQWHMAGFLGDSRQTLLCRGFVLTMLIACMVSSPLIDHAEGWFFAFMSAVLFKGLNGWKMLPSEEDGEIF